MTRRNVLMTLAVVGSLFVLPGCYGASAGYVGVYGQPYYGPGAWGAYPYAGRYPPMGGGVWIGAPVCCEDHEQDSDQDANSAVPETPPSPSAEPPSAEPPAAEASDSTEAKSTSVPRVEEGSAW